MLDRPDASFEVGSSERARKPRQGPVLRSRSQAQSPGLVVRPVVIAVLVDGARTTPNNSTGSVGDRPRDDDVNSSIHQNRRRVLEDINYVDPSSSIHWSFVGQNDNFFFNLGYGGEQ